MLRIAINGFGRIGRHAFKVIQDHAEMDVVAVNDLTDTKTLAHLLTYDTAYPPFAHEVSFDNDELIVDGKHIPAYKERDPAALPWGDLNVDIVLECTGVFRTREGAQKHLQAGAKRVIISAPGKGEGISCFVRGINAEAYREEDIVDNASCTTNCAAPVMQVLEQTFGVDKAMLTTVHSYTASQNLQDGPHKDLREARAAAMNLIPTSTGSAVATAKVIPSLAGNFDGLAVRVPTLNVSITDITAVLKKDVTVEEVNAAFADAAQTYLSGILAVSEKPLVSTDYIGDPHSATVDLPLTRVVGGNLVKVMAWYDNEWGYANRLVELAEYIGKKV